MQYKLIKFALFINSFYVFSLLARQILGFDTITYFLIGSQLFLLAVAFTGFKLIRFKRIELFLLFLLCISLLGSDFDVYRIEDICVDLFKPLIFIVAVASIRSNQSLDPFFDPDLKKIFSCYVITTVISVAVGIFYYSFVSPIYPAYSSIYSIIGYFYLIKTSRRYSVAYILLLLFSGKRAVIVSAVFAQGIASKLFTKSATFYSLLVLMFFVGVFLLVDGFREYFFANVFKVDMEYFSSLSSDFEKIQYLTGGRLDEIVDGLNYEITWKNSMFGKSLGYTYESSAFEESNHKNFHFTPVSIFVNYGLLFLVVFSYYILSTLFSKPVERLSHNSINAYVLRMYLIGSIFFFATEYGVFGYINFCVAFGLISRSCLLQNLRSPELHKYAVAPNFKL